MSNNPYVTFIHVPSGKRNAGDKVLLDKVKEISWKKGDIIVLLTGNNFLSLHSIENIGRIHCVDQRDALLLLTLKNWNDQHRFNCFQQMLK